MIEVIVEGTPKPKSITTKECVCPHCSSVLEVPGTELGPSFAHYLCPICNSVNEWLSPEEKRILAIVKKALDQYSDLSKLLVPKSKHTKLDADKTLIYQSTKTNLQYLRGGLNNV